MSPGAHPFERFGHAALLVDRSGSDGDGALVYNYGTFDANDPELVQKFLRHTMPFWLSVGTWRDTKRLYARRSILIQELDLDEEEARVLAARLADNARPAHRMYVYEFFRDNCSTRVRDMVSSVVRELTQAQEQPPRASLRGHVRDVLAPVPLFRRAIDLALNERVDAPGSRWDDAFLPRELAILLRETRRLDGRPVVAREHLWTGPEFRDLTRPLSPSLSWGLELGWLLLLLPLVLAAGLGMRRPATRTLGGSGLALWGLATGLIGVGLAVMATTPYDVARHNANLLALWPGLLALVPYGVRLALGRLDAKGWLRLRILVMLVLVPVLLDVGWHLLGRAQQRHLELLLFVAAGHLLTLVGLRGGPAPEISPQRDGACDSPLALPRA
ncbi:MAG TPA: DUF4105 domain-containing protein [Polyangia bacterium]|jgi:hypothetical protein|nr:DUF4105 domain-containing protein [Polyangia bacterium]